MRSVVPVSFMPTKREALYLGTLALIAIVIQAIMLPAQAGGPDMTTYVAIAKDEISQPGFWSNPDSFVGNFWAMGYPTFLAVITRITGEDLTRVLYLQMPMAASLIAVPWILARRLPKAVQFAAPAVLVLSPALWWMGTSIGYEVLLAWLLCFSLAFAWIAYEWDAARHARATVVLALLSGLLLAGALLTQTKVLAVLPVIAYLLYRGGRRTALWGALGLIAGLLPWMIRNLFVLGTPSPLTGNAGYNLWVGNNPDAVNGGSMLVAPDTPAGETMTTAAIKFILSQPERWIELTWNKAARLLQTVFVYPDIVPAGPARTLLHAYAGALGVVLVVGVLLFIGAWVVNGRRAVPPVVPLAVFAILWFAAHLPFIAEARYMTSIAPITTTVALAAWAAALQRMRGKQQAAMGLASPREAHAMVQALEREGMATALDLSNPGWRTEGLVRSTLEIAPSTTLRIAAQACGLDSEDHSWPAYYARTLDDTLLDVDSGLLFAEGRVIAQSGSGTRASRDAAFVSGATFRVKQATPTRIQGPIAPLGDVHHHYHVMIETLPRIRQALALEPRTTFVTSTEIQPRYQAVLDAWGTKVQHIAPGTVLSPESVILVDQPELFWPRPADIEALRNAFDITSDRNDATERLYVSRRKAARSIEGEDLLEERMRERGYRPVLLEEMTIREQVDLFARAQAVLAPHGAGLAGIAFMPEGARVVEITSGEVFEQCYRRIAGLRNLDYTTIVVEGAEGTEFGTADAILRALDLRHV